MEVGLVIKAVGVGVIVAVACQVLAKSGRDEQATLVSLTGIVIILLMVVEQLGKLFSTIRSVFGI